jgi:hypothetical protein
LTHLVGHAADRQPQRASLVPSLVRGTKWQFDACQCSQGSQVNADNFVREESTKFRRHLQQAENLRDAAYHEAGHVVVAQFLGLTVREVEIEEDGSGRADIRYAEHLPLVDQVAICVAGIEAQELFNCPMHQHAALGDYLKVCELMAGLTDAESYEYRQAGYLRALEILMARLPEIEALAHQLLKQRRIAA